MGSVSKNFDGFEVLPRELYYKFGDQAMRYLNPKIIIILQIIRDFYNVKVSVNEWKTGGIDGRTIRLVSDKCFNEFSDHTYGNAVDFSVEGKTGSEVFHDVLFDVKLNTLLKEAGVTATEKDRKTWVHLSVADFTAWTHIEEVNGIKILNP